MDEKILDNFPKLKALYDENDGGKSLREQIIISGLFIMIFERFKKYAVDQIKGFYSDYVLLNEGKLVFTESEKYK